MNVVSVPLSLQLLSLAVLLQFVAFMSVFWRGLLGLPQLSTRRPRWPFIPLALGTGAGIWYAVLQRDLVIGVAQCLALFIGYCLLNSTRGKEPDPALAGLSRRERRAAKRAAKRGDASGE